MFIYFGERMCGKVDRVPGVCHVATRFIHIYFLPVAPVRSYLVIEGSEQKDGRFNGLKLPYRWKSVLVGYARAWVGMLVLLFGILLATSLGKVFAAWGDAGVIDAAAGAVLLGLTAAVFFAPVRWAVFAQLAFHIVTVAAWAVADATVHDAQAPARAAKEALDGLAIGTLLTNLCLAVYGLTRFADTAGEARARDLLARLGIEREEPAGPWDEGEYR